MVTYRAFRNDDPPGLASVWNESLTARGGVRLKHSSPLENYVFAKPYFEPSGLIVAVEDGQLVGFAHAGFGPNPNQTALRRNCGVLCVIAVRPSHQRRGIGSELLRKSEAYLTERGARSFYAGPMAPHNPFYFALYGGSELPGFLTSDEAAEGFLKKHGYEPQERCFVLQRQLHEPLQIVDGRFPTLRRRYDVRIVPRTGITSWWQECVLGPVELVDFRLEDKTTNEFVGRTSVWEMDLFSWRWNQPSVGVLEVEVREELRRQGLAKYVLTQMLHYLQDQFFGIAEAHVMEGNEVGIKMFQGLGFQQVDIGRHFKKTAGGQSA